jgi:transposase InsO family protein
VGRGFLTLLDRALPPPLRGDGASMPALLQNGYRPIQLEQWMNAIGVGVPTASRLAATTVRRCAVAFALDCCDREAMSFLATTGGIRGEDVRDLMVAAVEHRLGRVSIACRSPSNGSLTTAAATSLVIPAASLASSVLSREQRRSKVAENGMAEAFVRTIKRDYVRVSPRPNAHTVMKHLPSWITHYNEVHPHKARMLDVLPAAFGGSWLAQSSSASHLAAGGAGFLILRQSFDRPKRYRC